MMGRCFRLGFGAEWVSAVLRLRVFLLQEDKDTSINTSWCRSYCGNHEAFALLRETLPRMVRRFEGMYRTLDSLHEIKGKKREALGIP